MICQNIPWFQSTGGRMKEEKEEKEEERRCIGNKVDGWRQLPDVLAASTRTIERRCS